LTFHHFIIITMPSKHQFSTRQTLVRKRSCLTESQLQATVHVPNSQPSASTIPTTSRQRDVNGSQYLSALR
jgi:UV DNA damage repair endonuclease